MSDAINPDHYKRLPAEAIEIIEAAIDKAPSNQAALLHGQVLKYVLRCWAKNGIEDLRKAKWYLDRLVESSDGGEQQKSADIKSLMDYPFGEPEPVNKQSLTTEPPDGWRWLEVGEVIRKGDRFWYEDAWHDRVGKIGVKFNEDHLGTIRRNKFEVGEKVVYVDDNQTIVFVVEGMRGDEAVVSFRRNINYALNRNKLAPYIEEQS